MMRKFYLLLLLLGICFSCSAQHEPADFFKGLFNSLKNADTAAFANSFLSNNQFGLLAEAQLKIKTINQDSLDNASEDDSVFRSYLANALFQRLLKKLDSLHLDRSSMQYLDYSYEQAKDTGVLCTSLRGAIYFKSSDKYYQWHIDEAILIKGIWKLMDPGEIDNLKNHSFLARPPQAVTVFNSLKTTTKVKVTSVILQPPPPVNMKPPPPPPPEPPLPKKKKEGK